MKLAHIINNTIEYRFNQDAINIIGVDNDSENGYDIVITNILGWEVDWSFGPFRIEDVYEYFEKQIFNDISSKLYKSNIGDCYKKNKVLANWLPEDTQDNVKLAMMETILRMNLNWTDFFLVMDQMGKEGLMGRDFYHNLVSGYVESVVTELFNINLKKVTFMTPNSIAHVKITFQDDTTILVGCDFFAGSQFYNEISREVHTGNLIHDIEIDVKMKLLQKFQGL